MLKLKSLQLQLQNLKVAFNDSLGNPEVSIEELRQIREQIKALEQLIEERKTFLFGRKSDN
jgi:hypothetical protein